MSNKHDRHRFAPGKLILLAIAGLFYTSYSAVSDFRLDLARKMAKEGKLELAIREYKTYLSENPRAPEIYEELANLRLKQGKTKFAIINFQMALKQNNESLSALEGLALAYEKGGEREKSLIEWRRLATQTDNKVIKNRAEEHIKAILEDLKKGNQKKEELAQAEARKNQKKVTPGSEGKKVTEKSSAEKDSDSDKPGQQAPGKKDPGNRDPGNSAPDKLEDGVVQSEKKKKPTVTKRKKKEEILPLSAHLKEEKDITPLTDIIFENMDNAKKILDQKVKDSKKGKTKHASGKRYKEASGKKPGASSGVETQKKAAGSRDIYRNTNFLKAIEYHNKGQNKSAIKEIRRALKTHPGHPGAYYYGGVIRYEMGELDKAAYNFKKGFKYPDMGFNGYFYLGRIYQKTGKLEEALEAYKKYISLTKSESGKKDAQKRIDEITGSSALSAKKRKRGARYVKVSETPNPDVTLISEKFVFYLPDVSNSKVNELKKAADHFTAGKLEKSLNKLKEISREFGGSQEADAAVLNMGVVYLRLGLFDKARAKIREYKNSPSKKIFHNQASYLMSLALIGQKNWRETEKLLKTVTADDSLGPSKRDIQQAYLNLYLNKPDQKKALATIDKLMKSTENKIETVDYKLQKARILQSMNRNTRAIDNFKSIVKGCSDESLKEACSKSFLSLAEIYFKAKKWNTAKKYYREFEQKYPGDKQIPWTMYQIANIDRRAGKYKQALDGYRNVMEKYPDSYWSTQAKWKRDDAIWQHEYKGVLD